METKATTEIADVPHRQTRLMMMKTEKYESLLSDYAYMKFKDGKAGM